MTVAVVTDTSFLIDVARGHEGARTLLDQLAETQQTLLVPTVVVAEYLAGSSDPHNDVEHIRGAGDVIELTLQDARAAGEFARESLAAGRFPGWSDALIAGVARSRGGLPIVTANDVHFPGSDTIVY